MTQRPQARKPRTRAYAAILALSLFAFLAGCAAKGAAGPGEGTQAATPPAKTTLTVFAGAGLKDALEKLGAEYTAKHPNVHVEYNFGAAGQLYQQIEAGGTADVFVAPGKKEIDALADAGKLLPTDLGTVVSVATNEIVLVGAKGGKPATFKDLPQALGDKGKLALGEPKSVPVGRYAEQALKAAGVWDAVKDRIVYAQTVRQVLAYVESGEANYGIVYASDAKVSDKVEIVDRAKPEWHDAIHFYAGVLKDAPHPSEAKDFLAFLLTPEAQKTFEAYGFSPGKGKLR
ncbi:molybdate ABC transporter substrate-binding protein [Brockia lithotrophica]|uniref:Molybdate transport system substrate-binding protein n=1 Tax=Brockia lithotrophica TaxID=933949 RepID=A0A660L4Q5_9BACL|nr:molybdate ABC transporter substrate-binding protein [Brockia lithotrophica]RKQ88906.1 molybdate transport system substrate-binding protein [Brockia lithotrophica]